MYSFTALINLLNKLRQQTFGSQSLNNVIISNTSPSTGEWYTLEVMDDAVIASIRIDGNTVTSLSGVTLKQGFRTYGQITAITLTSGIVRLYAGDNKQ